MDINEFSTPINRTAAYVTGQPDHERETLFVRALTELENLKRARHATEIMRAKADNKEEKKNLGVRIMELNEALRIKKLDVKALNNHKRATIQELMIRECRDRFTDDEWKEIEAAANQKFRRDEQ